MQRLRRKLRTALSLSWGEWLILCQAWVYLLVVDLGLRVLPFRRVQDWAARGFGDEVVRQAHEPWAEIERLQRLGDMAGRNHLYAMHCLPRSLVLQRMLAQRGIASKLRLGVAKEAAQFQAHAWVEYQGRVLNDDDQIRQRFAALDLGPDLELLSGPIGVVRPPLVRPGAVEGRKSR